MMDISRKDFEEFHTKTCGLTGTDLASEFDLDAAGDYIYFGAKDGWKYWQASRLAANKDSCQWNPDEDYVYSTSCGNEWQFTEGGIEENEIKFCPYCSGKISAPKPESE